MKASEIKVLELKGMDGLRCYQAFNSLLLGMKMLPMYQDLSFEDWILMVDAMDESGKEKVIRNGANFVSIESEEIKSIISFCCDANGVPYTKENLRNLNPLHLIECVVAVSMNIMRFKVDILTEEEKKKSLMGQSI